MEGNLELPNKIASPRGRKFPELGRKRSKWNTFLENLLAYNSVSSFSQGLAGVQIEGKCHSIALNPHFVSTG